MSFPKISSAVKLLILHTGAAMDLGGTVEILPGTFTNPEIHNFPLSIHFSYYTQEQYQSQ